MKVLLLAGEESGVLYAERIVAEIRGRGVPVEVRGYGDSGFRVADLAVMGIGQVLRRIFYFARVKRTMERVIDDWRPDVVCTVDYPGMNLRLAAYAKARGVRTVHVVCPQVWAWKKGRIPKIEASLDRLCCFFPFEPALFKPGFAEFVGHPLVDEMREDEVARGSGGRERNEKTLAVLPGSRIGEIERNLPVMLEAVGVLTAEFGERIRYVVPAANQRAFDKIASVMRSWRTRTAVRALDGADKIKCVIETRIGGAREVLRQADAAIVASGTATLEAALAGCPTVLVYRVGWLFALIARAVIRGIRHIGLANIVAEKASTACPMPELLQEDCTVGNVLQHVRPWLTDEAANAAARQSLAETMRLLTSDGGAIARIVDQILP